jgi:hypothetical protein
MAMSYSGLVRVFFPNQEAPGSICAVLQEWRYKSDFPEKDRGAEVIHLVDTLARQ